MKRDLIERLVGCFGYIGPANTRIPEKFAHRVRPGFIHPSISPCILKPGERLALSDLEKLTHGFFSVVGPKDEQTPAAETAQSAGWVETWRDSIEHFDSFIESRRPPDGFAFDMGDVQKDLALRARIMTMSQTVFKMPDEMAAKLSGIISDTSARVFGVVARDRDGADVASGLVMCQGDTGFFTGGSIVESHRGLGLWRHVARFRQEISYDAGVRHWFYNTASPRLTGKGDRTTQMVTYFPKTA
jgi:hypothetical protein